MNRGDARNGLLQARGEEVTIRRTLPQLSYEQRLRSREMETAECRLLLLLFRRHAGLTAWLSVAPLAPVKKQEKPELAKSPAKKQGKI